jgi:hypothetical protein
MRYHDVQAADVRLPRGYPVLAEVSIDPANLFDFEQRLGDTAVTRILGHNEPEDGRMVVHVACASTSVRDRIADGWE